MGERGSLRAYAKHRGVTLSSVQKARDSGRIPRPGPDGLVDFEECDRRWDSSTDLSKPRNTITGKPKGRKAPGGPGAPMGATGKDAGEGGAPGGNGSGVPDFVATYGNAKAVRETYLAKLAELDYETRRGQVVETEVFKRTLFACGRRGRDGVLTMADRVANRCEHKTSDQIWAIVDAEAKKVVEEMSRGIPKITIDELKRWLRELEDEGNR